MVAEEKGTNVDGIPWKAACRLRDLIGSGNVSGFGLVLFHPRLAHPRLALSCCTHSLFLLRPSCLTPGKPTTLHRSRILTRL